MKTRICFMAVAAGLICAPAFAAPLAAVPDPWAKVPALPTACYTSQDNYFKQHEAALAAVQQTHQKQYEINSAIEQKFEDEQTANPMAMQAMEQAMEQAKEQAEEQAMQAMQQAMMNDPQNAQKYIEQMIQQGEQAQTEAPTPLKKEQQLEAERKTVLQQYQAALAKAMGPAEARWTALKKKMGIAMDSGGPGELGVPDWAWAEWVVILRERDNAYAANCPRWWTATGPIHAYMKRYKDYLVLERIPFEKKRDEAQLDQYRQLQVPTAGWRTTTDYQAAEDYMNMAYSLFRQRKTDPL